MSVGAPDPNREAAGRPADNRAALVRTAVVGRIAPPRFDIGLAVDRQGRGVLLPGSGGVNLGVHAGDPVDGWDADHLIAGASVEEEGDNPAAAGPLHLLSCVGNRVRDAAGAPVGAVAAKRGGLGPNALPPTLLGIEVPDAVAARLAPGDRVVVEAVGRGLAFPQWPEIGLMNLSPALLDALPLRATADGIAVAVRRVGPARLAGSGLGTDGWVGDLEITGADAAAGLRFGDLVAFTDMDGRSGRFYRPGHVALGLVAHGPSPVPGHGVGVTLLIAGPAGRIALEVRDDAALGPVLRAMAA